MADPVTTSRSPPWTVRGTPTRSPPTPHDVDPRFVVQHNAATALVAKPGARPDLSADLL